MSALPGTACPGPPRHGTLQQRHRAPVAHRLPRHPCRRSTAGPTPARSLSWTHDPPPEWAHLT
eukprot:10265064-Alexandrium_andersonii.AAC.1